MEININEDVIIIKPLKGKRLMIKENNDALIISQHEKIAESNKNI